MSLWERSVCLFSGLVYLLSTLRLSMFNRRCFNRLRRFTIKEKIKLDPQLPWWHWRECFGVKLAFLI